MPVQIYWDTPEHAQIVVELVAPIQWSEFHSGITDAHQTLATEDHPVDIIILGNAGLPAGFALPHFRAMMKAQPPNTGRVIVIPEAKPRMLGFFKQLASVLRQTLPQKSAVVFVSSIEEARKLKPAPALDSA